MQKMQGGAVHESFEQVLSAQNKVVDESRKTPHNLISLLLTNKTICRQARSGNAGAQKQVL
jgi:hypothetical protein